MALSVTYPNGPRVIRDQRGVSVYFEDAAVAPEKIAYHAVRAAENVKHAWLFLKGCLDQEALKHFDPGLEIHELGKFDDPQLGECWLYRVAYAHSPLFRPVPPAGLVDARPFFGVLAENAYLIQAPALPIEAMKELLMAIEDAASWETFVEHQTNGDCMMIARSLARSFPAWLTHVVGNVKTDKPYRSEDGHTDHYIIHHWCRDPYGRIWDFAKWTLKGYVEFADVYDPAVEDPEIYHGAHSVAY